MLGYDRFRAALFLSLSGLIVATFFSAKSARADYFVRAATQVQTSGFGISDPQFHTDDTGQVQALSISSGPFTVTSTDPNYATATASAVSSLGALHGSASFTAATADLPAGGNAQGNPESWGDVITITSDTLPIGTPVTLQATLTFDRTITGSQPHDNNIQIQADATASFGLDISDSYYFPNSTVSQSTLVSFLRVGDTFNITGGLSFSAAGTAFYNDTPLSGSIDISDTAVFNLISLTPGASYTTDSGVSYVPEPSSLVLAMFGLLACGAVRRCKARS